MEINYLKSAVTAAAGLALIVTTVTACTHMQTTDTRLGELVFENGYPSQEKRTAIA